MAKILRNILILCASAMLTLSVYSTSQSQPIFIGINCGSGMPFTNSQGDLFTPDEPYSPTTGYGFQGGAIPPMNNFLMCGGNENHNPLYWNCREGDFSYLFDLPPEQYAVTLFLAELTFHWQDFRTFSVSIENDTLVQELDIFEQVGRQYALPLRFLTECVDGQLNIDFIPGIEGGTVCAVSVCEIDPDSIPPEHIYGFSTIGGYEMNILDWCGDQSPDLAGYRVYRRSSGEPWELLTPEIHPLSRFLDYEVVPYTEYEYQVAIEDLWGNVSTLSDSLSATPVPNETTQLPRYQMEITEENLYLLNVDIWSDEYVEADLTIEGEFFPEAGVRYRGGITRPRSKKNYKLNLPQGHLFNLRDKFNLQAELADISMLRDRLCYEAFDLLGCFNPLFQNVHLQRNDEFIGVYLDIEQINNHFLERNGLSTSGNLYKCASTLCLLPHYGAYQCHYFKENNPNSDWYDIIDFIEWLNSSSPEEFHDEAGCRFAVDEYLDNYTALIAAGDMDFVAHNYYMYLNPLDERWYFFNYDHSYSFSLYNTPIDLGTQNNPLPNIDVWNVLLDKVMEDSLFRYSYCKKLERFLNGGFSIQQFQNLIAAAHSEIEYDAVRDVHKHGWENPNLFLNNGPNELNDFIEARVPFLLSEIPSFITNPDLSPYFRLNEIQSNNLTTIADEAGDFDPWLEITNLAPVELDLTGFTLHYGNDWWTLPAEAVVDDYGFIIFWLDGEPEEGPLHASFTLNPDSGSIRLESGNGIIADTVAFPLLNPDQVWARDLDGIGDWTDNFAPTPGTTNNPPENPSPLVINEFLAINNNVNPDPAGEYDDWIEIYNPTENTIPLGGLYLTDDLARPTIWAFPDTAILPASFIIVWCDNNPEQGLMHTTFSLTGEGEQIGLFDRNGITPIDTITYTQQTTDISFGRLPDGADNWSSLNPTPGTPNAALPIIANPIVITEINYHSADNFNPEDWVEFYNDSCEIIDISGWVFKDEEDDHIFTFPPNTVLEPGMLIVLCRDTSAFSVLFPEVDNYLGNFDFGLSNGGELIRLFDSQERIIDSLTYDDNPPWPVEPDGNGPTLELIDPSLLNEDPENWRASIAPHGSPGQENGWLISPIEDLFIWCEGEEVHLEWSDVAEAEIYYIYRSTQPYFDISGMTVYDTSTTSDYTDYNAINEGCYYCVTWE